MWTYYRDITIYPIGLTVFILLYQFLKNGDFKSAVIFSGLFFAIFGTGLGVLAFNYFQKRQYYMYYNLGFSKTYLILKSWAYNFSIGMMISLIASILF